MIWSDRIEIGVCSRSDTAILASCSHSARRLARFRASITKRRKSSPAASTPSLEIRGGAGVLRLVSFREFSVAA